MLAAAGLLLGIGALVFLVLAVTRSGRFGSSSPLRPSDAEFNLGDASARAAAISRDRTPLLFQDPADFERPIWVNHLGSDADSDTGWYAFAAAIGSCEVSWDVDRQEFVDCDGQTFPADGTGLRQFDVRVEAGEVIVDLDPDSPTTTVASSSTTIPESGG
jgi:hypothetical protein